MLKFRRIAEAVLPADARPAPTIPDAAIDAAWFEGDACRNCGAHRPAPHCGECGQKAATRLALGELRKESWERLRLFEAAQLRTLWRLVVSPGAVAREYVFGRRSAHLHPLKLLVALVAILALILAANRYLAVAGHDKALDAATARMLAYANWSFSLGIFAIFLGSWIAFGRRLGYNIVEHAVLSIYCQSLILAAVIINLLPTLIWHTPAFIQAHKAASQYYLYAIKLLIVATGYTQFFRLRIGTDWPRLLLACMIYVGSGWVLLRIYALAILWLVSR